MKRIIALAAVLGLFAATAATIAAKAGNSAYVTVTPAAPVAGDALIFAGCGFQSPKNNYSEVAVFIFGPNVDQSVLVPVDSNGCFTTDGYLSLTAVSGDYSVSAQQASKAHQASLGFTVG